MKKAFIFLFVTFSIFQVSAYAITYDFSGIFSSSNSNILNNFGLTKESIVSGSITYDENALPHLGSSSTFSNYLFAISDFSFDIINSGNTVFSGGALSGNISIGNSLPSQGNDVISFSGSGGLTGSLGPYPLRPFGLVLTDYDSSVFSTTSLSQNLPALDEFEEAELQLLFGSFESINYNITSLNPSGRHFIPEPATMLLFGTSLIGLLLIRQRKKTTARQ